MMISLSGRRVIVTRSSERAAGLSVLLRAAGAEVIEIPVTATVDPDDGGKALSEAVNSLAQYEWVVITSPEGARRFRFTVDKLRPDASARTYKTAAVGRATAEILGGADLVPDIQMGSSLGACFPVGYGRVLLAVAQEASTDFEKVARAKGWSVDRVTSYRTIDFSPTHVSSQEISSADAITFASASSVRAWVANFGKNMPDVVVAMGPMTATALADAGIGAVAVAAEQSLEGLVTAVADALGSR